MQFAHSPGCATLHKALISCYERGTTTHWLLPHTVQRFAAKEVSQAGMHRLWGRDPLCLYSVWNCSHLATRAPGKYQHQSRMLGKPTKSISIKDGLVNIHCPGCLWQGRINSRRSGKWGKGKGGGKHTCKIGRELDWLMEFIFLLLPSNQRARNYSHGFMLPAICALLTFLWIYFLHPFPHLLSILQRTQKDLHELLWVFSTQ